jgi:hypothetical protein
MIFGFVCEELTRADAGIGITMGIKMGQLLMSAFAGMKKAVAENVPTAHFTVFRLFTRFIKCERNKGWMENRN